MVNVPLYRNILALVATLLWSATSAQAQTLLAFDPQPGHWLAQVAGGDTGHGYAGYASNYPPATAYGPNFGPAIPGGFPIEVGAFFDVDTGNFGVAGASNTGSSGASAYFNESFQFASAGRFTLSSHFMGVIGTGGRTSSFVYEAANLVEFLGIRDDSHSASGWDAAATASICGVTTVGLASCNTNITSSASIDTDLVAAYDVIPGHTYTIQISESGMQIGNLEFFDGIDPSTVSVQLSPGLTFAATPGFDPPPFVTGAMTSPVPEPSELAGMLAGLGLMGCLFGSSRRRATRS